MFVPYPKPARRRSAWHVDPSPAPNFLLDALEQPCTFYDMNCRAGRGDFNGSKIFGKDECLSQKMRLEILLRRAAPVPHPDQFVARWLPTSHTLKDIIVALSRLNWPEDFRGG